MGRRPLPEQFTIVANPSFRAASPGAKITYSLRETPGGPKLEAVKAFWTVVNDPKTVNLVRPSTVIGPQGPVFRDVEATFPGRHRIICHVTVQGVTTAYTYEQWVVPSVDLVDGPTLPPSVGHPDSVLDALKRKIVVLESIAKTAPPAEKDKETFRKSLEDLRDFQSKLEERLKSTRNFVRHAIQAEFFDAATQKRAPLRLFLSKVGFDKWLLVDWTQPQVRSATGEYSGSGDTAEKAIRAAFEDWDEDNRYPAGAVTFKVSPFRTDVDRVPEIKGEFETDGTAFWDSVSSFFGWVGLGAAVVAGVVTLVAPVPGSQVVSALIWTSIFSSTAAAAINIGTRADEGFSSWQANAFDILTIVGNLFGATGLLWSRGATVLVNRGNSVVKFALIGSVTTDGVQGVMLGAELVQQFDAIQADKTLSPDQRLNRLSELFRSALANGLLIYVSIKGTKADLENLKLASGGGASPEQKLKELADPAKTVDLTAPPRIGGKAGTGPHTTKVDTDQEMQNPNIGSKSPGPFNKPKPPPKGPQTTDDLDELFKQAEIAHKELGRFTRGMAKELDALADVPPTVKRRERTEKKIASDYEGDASQIMDLARSTLVFKSFARLEQAFQLVQQRLKVVKTKDAFAAPLNGYRDMKIYARMSNGHVVEIQLHLEAILKAKKAKGDDLYGQIRPIHALKKTRKLTAEENKELVRLIDEQTKLFDEAFVKAGGKI